MKRIIISLCFIALIPGRALAQDSGRQAGTLTQKGDRILPVKGDFAFGIELNPFFDYFGNMFNARSDNAAPYLEGMDLSLNGKYFITDRQAVRVGLSMNFDRRQYKHLVQDDARIISEPEVFNPTVNDVLKVSSDDFTLSAGYEFRRGYGRLQGFWGAEASFGFGRTKELYEYGNAMTELNPMPSTYRWDYDQVLRSGLRILNYNVDSFRAGLGLFAGVEYFIAAKLSIGAELCLSMNYSWRGQEETEFERFDTKLGEVQTYKERYLRRLSSSFGFTSVPAGSLYMTFHF